MFFKAKKMRLNSESQKAGILDTEEHFKKIPYNFVLFYARFEDTPGQNTKVLTNIQILYRISSNVIKPALLQY